MELKLIYVCFVVYDNGNNKGEIKEGVGFMSIKFWVKFMGVIVNIDNYVGFLIVVFVLMKSRREEL